MYVDETVAVGPLTAELAEEVAARAGRYTSRITLACHGRRVHAPLLPLCRDELRVRTGDTITVTAAGGHHPPDLEDRRALRDVMDAFADYRTGI
jgi:hypothetical protein